MACSDVQACPNPLVHALLPAGLLPWATFSSRVEFTCMCPNLCGTWYSSFCLCLPATKLKLQEDKPEDAYQVLEPDILHQRKRMCIRVHAVNHGLAYWLLYSNVFIIELYNGEFSLPKPSHACMIQITFITSHVCLLLA